MHKRSKLLFAALIATLALSIGAGTASASRSIEVSPTASTATFPALVFSSSEGGVSITCRVVLTQRLHERIAKTVGALVGFITEVDVRECRGGGAIVRRETLPWHLQLVSFTGTLPRITSVRLRIIRATFLLEVFGVRCRYQGNPEGTTNGPEVTSLRADPAISIPGGGEFLCPPSGNFAGSATVSPTVRMRLV